MQLYIWLYYKKLHLLYSYVKVKNMINDMRIPSIKNVNHCWLINQLVVDKQNIKKLEGNEWVKRERLKPYSIIGP